MIPPGKEEYDLDALLEKCPVCGSLLEGWRMSYGGVNCPKGHYLTSSGNYHTDIVIGTGKFRKTFHFDEMDPPDLQKRHDEHLELVREKWRNGELPEPGPGDHCIGLPQ